MLILSSLSRWAKNNRNEALVLATILALATIFRLWRIDEYLPFMGDEGRDVRVVYRFLTNFDLMFIGPRTSIGDMYLGPLYYYFIAPLLFLFRFSPTGPAVSVAVIGIATVALLFYVAREWFGKKAAAVASFLYASAPILINLSKHSWNPNIMPFFALLSIYSMWRVWSKKEYRWLLILGISYAFVLQSHYLGLLLLPTLALMWASSFLSAKSSPGTLHKLLLLSLFAFLLFIFLMSPLFLFDYKHGWHNLQSVKLFFAHRQETVSAKPWNALPALWPLWQGKVVMELVTASQKVLSVAVSALVVTGTTHYIWSARKSLQTRLLKINTPVTPFILTLTWIGTGLLGLGSLKQSIFAHYFGFMFPAVFLLLGALYEKYWQGKLKLVVLTTLILISVANLVNNPLKYAPQRQMQRVQEVNKKIIEEANGKPFNFGLVAKRNYEEGYLYFFELSGSPVRIVDPQHKETITDQLFVVCEDSDCQSPVYSAKSEVAHFGPSKVEKEWEIGGVKLYKLTHHAI
ncbi:MAG: hypothetical protein A2700_01560 [Candidatus Blackburnbacteria bacterium RIFCSPHIGHO2_01_FULL_44_64]|uniref:Glycosyltransferase RgtA/B/C/D-like domain-containing protein n=1 Tax=Candidatus Blackburnbacteria bacterium RIFCSPHIGHO2_02_FULL_44_20 TaxID=1797516 RepID=A0A1G1V9A7_9BACT|nr:MAG: hypothetical protein A2700_01560 [Candidatus Blackburnbacteria bacterium RIFCSPHIGHO2_01_FULL_44_64]OGY11254.1 MAG: hypothetical protein A3E16_01650 [Candidatus Blackburnbacteria bacterium RIFCSPHIGHO2_12_FULL_44_25]OGY11943.1 MAG: hypothetical protein A3D26_03060 [Candidatus Blackburnbacteria bacterium RIFCSPHIGHO2_02_FULL_44_20]OGY13344.1 MAG: hypothetical protein A3A62_03575 [Candidatus Blackburnbacteria bacterium RIFCSPLOWO2_01_FULL_44_43]